MRTIKNRKKITAEILELLYKGTVNSNKESEKNSDIEDAHVGSFSLRTGGEDILIGRTAQLSCGRITCVRACSPGSYTMQQCFKVVESPLDNTRTYTPVSQRYFPLLIKKAYEQASARKQ